MGTRVGKPNPHPTSRLTTQKPLRYRVFTSPHLLPAAAGCPRFSLSRLHRPLGYRAGAPLTGFVWSVIFV